MVWDNFKCRFFQGYTLLELLLTLSLILIILMLTLSRQNQFLMTAQEQTLYFKLLRSINLSRSEAILRGETISLCKSADQKTCAGQWQDGFLISSPEKVLYSYRNFYNKGTLSWRGFPERIDNLQFLPTGMLHAENGTFWYCADGAKLPSWAIVISQSGRVRSEVGGEINIECKS